MHESDLRNCNFSEFRCNISHTQILLDEINRSSAKTQSAQLDRFLLKVKLGYPDANNGDYVAGDDIKDVDWKASARSRKLLVRQYIAEKKHNIMLVRASHSMKEKSGNCNCTGGRPLCGTFGLNFQCGCAKI